MWFWFALISTVLWAVVNIIDSFFVHRYKVKPIALVWCYSILTVLLALPIAFVIDVRDPWWWLSSIGGMTLLLPIWVYFVAMKHLDASIVNAAWMFEVIIISIIGIFMFGELWQFNHWIGALLSVGGILLLTFWHHELPGLKGFLFLFFLGITGAPESIISKWILENGSTAEGVFFWNRIGLAVATITFPMFLTTNRQAVRDSFKELDRNYVLLLLVIALSVIGGTYLWYRAIDPSGYLSLSALISNTLPLFIILIAAIMSVLFPRFIIKESLDGQALSVKIVCFVIIAIGLTFIGLGS